MSDIYTAVGKKLLGVCFTWRLSVCSLRYIYAIIQWTVAVDFSWRYHEVCENIFEKFTPSLRRLASRKDRTRPMYRINDSVLASQTPLLTNALT